MPCDKDKQKGSLSGLPLAYSDRDLAGQDTTCKTQVLNRKCITSPSLTI